MKDDDQLKTLILGGTGKIGRRVAERLRGRGVPVRVGSRQGEPPFDSNDRSTWEQTLVSARAAFVPFYPDLALPGAACHDRRAHAACRGVGCPTAGAAVGPGGRGGGARRASGAGRGRRVDGRALQLVQPELQRELPARAGAGRRGGPAGGRRARAVDAEDIADVALAALTENGHAEQLYELTGPRLLRFDDAVAEISRASGRPVRFVPVSVEQYVAAMAEQGVPTDVVALMTYLFSEVLDGRNAHLMDGVQRALAREPRDFRDYAAHAAATGLWAG